MKLFGKDVLFTDIRIPKDLLPKNIHRYELRHDDEGWGEICQIAPNILVNFYGTILSKNELALNNDYYRDINEEVDIKHSTKPSLTISEYTKQNIKHHHLTR